MTPLKQKVFGIGLNKTGTTTLGACMEQFGYNHLSHSAANVALYHQGDIDGLINIANKYDSFEDWPWPLVYKELAEAFPDAKFILTMRRTPEVWLESLTQHSYKLPPKENYHDLIYGYKYPATNKSYHLDFYNSHNNAVVSYFKNQPGRLLVVNWERNASWKELCDFLGQETPDLEFPHVGSTSNWHVSNMRLVTNHLLLYKEWASQRIRDL